MTARLDNSTEHSTTEITSWVTPKLEQILVRAADIANARGYNYLGDEHVLLAMLEDDGSQLRRSWTPDLGEETGDLHQRITGSLPPRQADHIGPSEPVRVTTTRTSPRI